MEGKIIYIVLMIISTLFIRWLINTIQYRKDNDDIQQRFYNDGAGPERPPLCDPDDSLSEHDLQRDRLISDLMSPAPIAHDESAEQTEFPSSNEHADNKSVSEDTENGSNQSSEDNNIKSQRNMTDKEKIHTENKEFLLQTLKVMGCDPIESEEIDHIYIKFQGENFLIIPNIRFLRIWDLPFNEVNMLDTNLSLIIETINKTNYSMGPTIILSDPDEYGIRHIQSRMDLVFGPFIPDAENYLSAIFDLFFQAKYNLNIRLEKCLDPSGEKDESNLSSSIPFLN